jgi:hypothetical protein
MASINDTPGVSSPEGPLAWNEAHDRLQNFLNTFALGNHSQVSRLTLKILDTVRQAHPQDFSGHPTTLVMAQTHKRLAEWLEINLDTRGRTPQQIFASGYLAMFLSQTFRTAPDSFLVSPLPEDLRHAMRQVLVITGPDLDVSSMTSRPVDYGPMLDLASHTWHQWNTRSIFMALLIWTGVYCFLYFWLSYLL